MHHIVVRWEYIVYCIYLYCSQNRNIFFYGEGRVPFKITIRCRSYNVALKKSVMVGCRFLFQMHEIWTVSRGIFFFRWGTIRPKSPYRSVILKYALCTIWENFFDRRWQDNDSLSMQYIDMESYHFFWSYGMKID